jgi:8-oxo-dGTP pyrophosphatase MutT (NUDIX family)
MSLVANASFYLNIGKHSYAKKPQMFHFQKNTKHCTNCGTNGHSFRDCHSPVTSFGTILFRVNHSNWSQEKTLSTNPQSLTGLEAVFQNIEILLIQRRDSLGYVDLLRGKYSINDADYIRKQLHGMTDVERQKLVEKDFDQMWAEMWGSESTDAQYKKDKENSRNKLIALREGITLDISGNTANLQDFVNECDVHWDTPEWGFPKGRRDGSETDLVCALREMTEETGLTEDDIRIVHNLEPLNETFFGSNHVHYCHKYFLIYVPDGSQVKYNPENPHMRREIGGIGWFTLNDGLQKIRSENVEKKEILLRVASLLRNYCALSHPV